MSKHARLADIDIAKGVAIVMVVAGHVVARDYRPAGNEWFLDFRTALYHFHMSFFFYLAGYIYGTARVEQYGQRMRRAFERMLPAYLFVAVLAFAAKLGLVAFVPVDRPIRSFWSDWVGMLLYPTSGFITFVWFIVALLQIYVLMFAVARWIPGRRCLWLALASGAHLAAAAGWVTELFAWHQVARYWLLFLLGQWAMVHRESTIIWMRRSWPLWFAALGAALVALPPQLLFSVPALLSIPALHGLSLWIADHRPRMRDALAWLGGASWPIYLFNAFAIGAVKAVILITFGWDGPRFLIALPLLLAGGLLLPVLAQRCLFSRVPWLDRIVG